MILLILLILSSIWAFGSTMTLMTYASEGENKNVVNNNMLFNLQALASISMLIWGFYKLYSQIEIGLLWYVLYFIGWQTFCFNSKFQQNSTFPCSDGAECLSIKLIRKN
jgi:hypothetical protein